jgi:hypothetical protein
MMNRRDLEIEMLFAPGCGAIESTRAMVAKAVADSGRDIAVKETVVADPAQAMALRFLGSPSVRVNGTDIDPEAASRAEFGLG